MNLFIIRLNWVDVLSLCGLTLALAAIQQVLSGRFDLALAMLLLAMAIDFMDGHLARRFKLTRDFGKYLDSFIDVMIYLAAPSVFLYAWGFDKAYQLLVIVGFVAMGVVRLSVFNEVGNVKDTAGSLKYLGMPVFWILFVLAGARVSSWIIPKPIVLGALTMVLPIYSVLMVSNRQCYKFNKPGPICTILIIAATVFVYAEWHHAG